MKYLTLTFLLLLSCRDKNKEQREVQKVDSNGKKYILISKNQSEPYETIKINNFDFDLVVDENADTVYLGTKDANFVTTEGFKVGTKFGQIPSDLKREIVKESGWGYYLTLDSKWNLGFCEGSSCTDNYPTDTSTVKWIFKRR